MSDQTIARLGSVIASQLGGWFPGASPYGRWYEQETGAKGFASSAFCAMGLSWAARQAGISTDVIPTFAWTPSGADYYRRQSRWTKGVRGIRRGDIWFSSCAGLGRISHVGWVESVHADGSFTTLEFNTAATVNGDQRNGRTVARKRRSSACSLGGYGRPKYEGAAPVARQPSARQREQLDLLDFANTLAFQEHLGLFPDGDMGPLTTNALTKEYDRMSQKILDAIATVETRLSTRIDDRTNDLGRALQRDTAAAIAAWQVDGAPDGVGKQVSQLFTKMQRHDAKVVLFNIAGEEGDCVAFVGTGTWMKAPTADTYKRFLDVLRVWLRLDSELVLVDWRTRTGNPDAQVVDSLAFGREVAWTRLPAPAADDAPAVEDPAADDVEADDVELMADDAPADLAPVEG